MRRLGWALAMVLALIPAMAKGQEVDQPSAQIQRIYLPTEIHLVLDSIAMNSAPGFEVPVCLYGYAEYDTYIINRYTYPTVTKRDFGAMTYYSCNLEALGSWHNHPSTLYDGACYVSNIDIETFLAGTQQFMMIYNRNGNRCAFTRAEIMAAVKENYSMIPKLIGRNEEGEIVYIKWDDS